MLVVLIGEDSLNLLNFYSAGTFLLLIVMGKKFFQWREVEIFWSEHVEVLLKIFVRSSHF